MGRYVNATLGVYNSEDTLQEPVLYHVGPRDQTQVFRFIKQALVPTKPSHLPWCGIF